VRGYDTNHVTSKKAQGQSTGLRHLCTTWPRKHEDRILISTPRSVKFKGHELLTETDEDFNVSVELWKLEYIKFTVKRLKEILAEAWGIPLDQFEIKFSDKMDPDTEYLLPKGFTLLWPEQGIAPERRAKVEK